MQYVWSENNYKKIDLASGKGILSLSCSNFYLHGNPSEESLAELEGR